MTTTTTLFGSKQATVIALLLLAGCCHVHAGFVAAFGRIATNHHPPNQTPPERHARCHPVVMRASSSSSSSVDNKVSTSTGSSSESPEQPLKGCVCLVTGGSRGIGKGIAIELGTQGAIVYVTGTTSSSSSSNDDKMDALGTVEETAAAVTAAGGLGIPVICNHADDTQVQALLDRIAAEQDGRLHMLVNNAFRLPQGGVQILNKPFWEQGAEVWDTLHTVGLRSHYVASCMAMPLLLKAAADRKDERPLPRPLIAMISSFAGLTYTFNVPYGVGKAAVERLAKDMAVDLDGKDISVVSFWPGVVLTERTLETVASGEWDKYVGVPLDFAESPNYTGKAIAAVATDPDNLTKTGTYQVVAELADEYGFQDSNGTRPPSIRSLRFLLPSYAMDETQRKQIPKWLIPDWKLPFWMMAQGKPPKPSETN